MQGYVSIHKIVDREIFVNVSKFRIYARLHGFISEGFFRNGQSALDATFALLSALSPPQIDYIFDIRMSAPWPQNILQLWEEKAFEAFAKYPQFCAVAVAGEDSPLLVQLLERKELFKKYGDRVLGIFKTAEDADAFLDTRRGYSNRP